MESKLSVVENLLGQGWDIYKVSGTFGDEYSQGYTFEYTLIDLDDDEDEYPYVQFTHCGLGQGCFSVSQKLSIFDNSNEEMLEILQGELQWSNKVTDLSVTLTKGGQVKVVEF